MSRVLASANLLARMALLPRCDMARVVQTGSIIMVVDTCQLASRLVLAVLLVCASAAAGCIEFDSTGVPGEEPEPEPDPGIPVPFGACAAEGYQSVPGAPGTYRFVETPLGWPEAQANCEQSGGHLVTVNDIFEHIALSLMVPDPAPGDGAKIEVWIGLNDQVTEGSYLWAEGIAALSDDAATGYPPWGNGQPDDSARPLRHEDCVKIQLDGPLTEWHDDACKELHPFLCECDS